MDTYFERNNNKRGYRPITRYLKVYFDKDIYFRFRGRRVKFDDIPALSYPIMVDDTDGTLIVIGGYMPLTNYHSFLVELHPDGESVRLWEEVEA